MSSVKPEPSTVEECNLELEILAIKRSLLRESAASGTNSLGYQARLHTQMQTMCCQV